ncbi:MAG: transporter permease [Firmicutes bacterium]|nr:transporter permease [Bacillota bacterium]
MAELATPIRPTAAARVRRWGASLGLLSPALALMLLSFVAPLILFFQYSFLTFKEGKLYDVYSLGAYVKFFTDPFYYKIIGNSVKLSGVVTCFTLLIGYPLAYALTRVRHPGLKKWLGVVIFSPMVVSVVVRTYGWMILLSDQGVINWLLLRLRIISEPLHLVFNMTGVVISLTHIFLPFVVFPIYSVLTKLDASLKEAASDLGAGWLTTFRRVTFPLSLPGVAAGGQIAFTLCLGSFVTPSLMGGGRLLVLPLNVYNNTVDINWPMAAVGGMTLLALAMATVTVFNSLIVKWTKGGVRV